MIITIFLNIIIAILGFLFALLPNVTTLPLGFDAVVSTAVGYLNGFLLVMWPLGIVWQCFIWYVGIRIVLMVVSFFIGHRAVSFGE